MLNETALWSSIEVIFAYTSLIYSLVADVQMW